MRLLFAGTPDIAVPSLQVIAAEHEVVGVLTNPDRPGRRGKNPIPPPVKAAAIDLGLKVFQPERLDTPFMESVSSLSPQLLVVVAYGRIFRPEFLALFPDGGINMHPSLLPRHRGCSPIRAAILAGDDETGITVQRLAEEMDAGDILAVEKIPLDGTETGGSLTELAGRKGADLLGVVLRNMEAGTIDVRPQGKAGISFCYRIEKEDGRINWSDPAVRIERQVRAYNPWPGAWTTWGEKRLMLYRSSVKDPEALPDSDSPPGKVLGVDKPSGFLVQTGSGVLAVAELQLQSKKIMDWKAFLNGNGTFPGSVLGSNI